MNTCRACGAPIIFVPTVNGKKMPCQPYPVYYEPDESGVKIQLDHGGIVRGAVLPEEPQSGPVRQGFIPHWDDCTNAEAFRSKSKTVRPPVQAVEPDEPSRAELPEPLPDWAQYFVDEPAEQLGFE